MITPAELALVDRLGECWDDFLALPVMHSDDRREFRTLIHHAQEKVLARSTLRQLESTVAPKRADL
ncbi:hypothetical protein ACIPPQ_14800 [Sphingopyxis sp. LARHCG72]